MWGGKNSSSIKGGENGKGGKMDGDGWKEGEFQGQH